MLLTEYFSLFAIKGLQLIFFKVYQEKNVTFIGSVKTVTSFTTYHFQNFLKKKPGRKQQNNSYIDLTVDLKHVCPGHLIFISI